MGDITTSGRAAFRDYVTDGLPASGRHEPVKAEIRAVFATIDTEVTAAADLGTEALETGQAAALIAAAADTKADEALEAYETLSLGNGAGFLTFATVVAMEADTTQADNVTAQVVENENVYRWDGAAWVLIGPNPNKRLLALEETEDQLSDSQRIGKSTTPVTGAGTFANNVYVPNQPVLVDGKLDVVSFYAKNGAGTLIIRRFAVSGTTATQVGSDLSIAFASTGLHTFTPADFGPFEVLADEYLGFYSNGEIASTTAPSDTYGYRTLSGNVTSGTLSGLAISAVLEIYVEVKSLAVSTERLDAVEAESVELDFVRNGKSALAKTVTQVIGTTTPTTGTQAGSNATTTLIQKIVADSLLKRVHFFAVGDGKLHIQRWTRASTTLTAAVEELVLDVVTGANSFDADDGDFEALACRAGEYIGFYAPDANFYVVSGSGFGYWNVTGPSKSYVDSSIAVNFIPQIGLEFDSEEVANVVEHGVLPGEPLSPADRVTAPVLGWTSCPAGGQSNALGSTGTEFYYTGLYANIMFAQGVRAVKSGSLAVGATSSDGGTASTAAAEENNISNTGEIQHGNTGFVRMVDRMVELAARDCGIQPADNVQFPVCVGKGNTSILDIGPNSNWWQDFQDLIEEQKARADEAGKAIKGLVYNLRIGATDALNNTLTPAQFKAGVLDLIDTASAHIRSVFGQKDRVHFLLQQPSCYITGTAGLGARDGAIAQAILELCEAYPHLHCVGGDYPWDHNNDHMDATGFTMAGERDAEACHDIIRLGRRPKTIMPLGSWFNGTTVTQRIWSIDPLQYDTTLLPSVTNKGLAVMVEGSLATLTGDATIDNAPSGAPSPYMRDLIFTLSSSASSSDEVQVRGAMDYLGSGIPLTAGASSNLRSSYSRTTTIDGVSKTISHWAPHFKRTALYIG